MIRGQSLRRVVRAKGPGRAALWILEALGVCDGRGVKGHDPLGIRTILESRGENGRALRFRPEEFSLRELAEAFVGPDWYAELTPDAVRHAVRDQQSRGLMEDYGAGYGAIPASSFANINAFTAVVAGLLEIKVMEGWKNPAYIADKLMPPDLTRMFDGRKVIGVTRAGDVAEPRYPLMPTKRINIAERWIVQPRTVENALSSEVSQEAVYLDLTGQVLQEASDLGSWLGWRKEIRCIDAFIGVTNSPNLPPNWGYNYKGTLYNPYISAGYFNNDISGNELLHWTNWQTVLVTFRDMLDPETGLRVLIQPDAVLVNMEKLVTARSIMGDLASGEVEYRDAPGSTSSPQQIRHFPAPYKGAVEILQSPLVYQRCTDATGLNLSATTAGKYWWAWEKGKFMMYAQNWPLRIQQASPQQLDMIDRGVVLFIKADERGVPMVYEPRRAVRSKP